MIAIYRYTDNDYNNSGVCYSYDTFFTATSTPLDYDAVILDGAHGLGYNERKADIRQQAIEYQRIISEGVSMGWSDVMEIGDYFSRYGRKYGLLKEFQENGIC